MSQESDPYRLHYTRAGQRCVAGYDTLGDALESALRRLRTNPSLEIWISDGGREPVLGREELLRRLEPTPPANPPPASG